MTAAAGSSRQLVRPGSRSVTAWVAASVSTIILAGCASIDDKFFDVYAYNSTQSPVIVTITTEGLENQRLTIQPLESLWIAPGDKCRYTTAVAANVRGRTIGEFEGDVCAEQHLTVTDGGISLGDSSAAEPSSGRGVDGIRAPAQDLRWT